MISDHPIDAEVKQIIEEVGEKMRELRVKREMLELLRVIVRIYERLKGVSEAVRDGRLKFAAEEVRELKKALRIGDEDEKEPIVYGLLRKEWFDCFEGVGFVFSYLLFFVVIIFKKNVFGCSENRGK